MTEKEILQQQESSGQKAFYLMAVGMFYHAYGCGAFALARATGYRVLRKHRKGGDILVCGFPANQLDTVLQRIREAGGEVEQTGEKTFLFRGLDGTPDETMVEESRGQVHDCSTAAYHATCPPDSPLDSDSWLADELLSFNLSLSTPMDAMNLIARLQRRLREEQKRKEEPQGHLTAETKLIDIACESPAGHGLQE